MWQKFKASSPSYNDLSTIDEAIRNCTPPADFGTNPKITCWYTLNCGLAAALPIELTALEDDLMAEEVKSPSEKKSLLISPSTTGERRL